MSRVVTVGAVTRVRRASGAIAAGAAAVLALSGCITIVTDGDRDRGPRAEIPADVARADVMFAQMMIPHHEQAVEMSELMLDRDDISPEIVELATVIIAEQEPEIALMESWLADWGMPSMRGMGGGMGGGGHEGHGMGGMLSDAELRAIAEADGVDAERLYLDGMIEHHEGAIDMAQRVLDTGRSQDVAELARAIITSQTREIALMRELLQERS
jgi:uncharacterized protein (DUF305 family)